MARAHQLSEWHESDDRGSGGDLDALRFELLGLLDQVEDQYSGGKRRNGPVHDGHEARARSRRSRMSGDPGSRHREALRSVRRAVDRFSDHEEDGFMETGNPQDLLQSAIDQIRVRQADWGGPAGRLPGETGGYEFDDGTNGHDGSPRGSQPLEKPAGDTASAPQTAENLVALTSLADAVTALSGRLGDVELALHKQGNDKGDIAKITNSVGQLTEVVDALARHVSENSNVTLLEDQIGQLAESLSSESRSDVIALTGRLDEMAATVERLADLQVHQNGQGAADIAAFGVSQDKSMRAIEKGVRNIYDRIDVLEHDNALQPKDVQRLIGEMASFTQEMQQMRAEGPSTSLLERVDALNARVEQFKTDGAELAVGGLKADLEALRDMVNDAIEPRFAALESQIADLSKYVSKEQRPDVSVGNLEAQIRHLVARMDQTGEQLNGLARQQAEVNKGPDIEVLAERVALRTSQEVAKAGPAGDAASASTALAETEARLSRLIKNGAGHGAKDFSGMHAGIAKVDERLARLEAALDRRSLAPAKFQVKAKSPAKPATSAKAPVSVTQGPDEPPAKTEVPVKRKARPDTMPADPAADAPLRAAPIGGAKPAAGRGIHPGLKRAGQSIFDTPGEKTPAPETAKTGASADTEPQVASPAGAGRPPKPASSFAPGAPESFSDAADKEPSGATAAGPHEATGKTASQATFIAAARKAVQASSQNSEDNGASSLIGRALARFQKSRDEGTAKPGKVAARPGKAANPEKPAKPAKINPRTEPALPETASKAGETPAAEPRVRARRRSVLGRTPSDLRPPPSDPNEAGESFLSRHRRPILLGATLVAVSLLALNLVAQRMGSTSPAVTETAINETAATSTPAAIDEQPAPEPDAAATGTLDPNPTGSAGGQLPPALMDPAPVRSIPMPLTSDTTGMIDTLTTATIDPADLVAPIAVEPPPEAIGPEALRTTAANGDRRAQFEVGAIFAEGRAVPQDFAAASIWFERAAAQGFAPAQYRLGALYEKGMGIEADLVQAKLWYQRAAESGNRMAMHNLASLYAGGQLGTQDFSSAAQWFEGAASRGMMDSQFNLGMLYARGLGVPQDLSQSYKWFSLAADLGDTDAAKARDDVAKSLETDALSAARTQIETWQTVELDLRANFAPIGTWAADFDPGQTITNTQVIRSVQVALDHLGFEAGTADGVMGPKTRNAISDFEAALGMSPSGKVNPRLLAILTSQPV